MVSFKHIYVTVSKADGFLCFYVWSLSPLSLEPQSITLLYSGLNTAIGLFYWGWQTELFPQDQLWYPVSNMAAKVTSATVNDWRRGGIGGAIQPLPSWAAFFSASISVGPQRRQSQSLTVWSKKPLTSKSPIKSVRGPFKKMFIFF